MAETDPGNAQPDDFVGGEVEDPTADQAETAEGARVTFNPDLDRVHDESNEIDTDDDDAVAQALVDGRRNDIDPRKLTFAQRMKFGLLTPEDDALRVRGELGDHMTSYDGDTSRTNVYDNRAGQDG